MDFAQIIDGVTVAFILGAVGTILKMWSNQNSLLQKQQAQDDAIKANEKAINHERDMRNKFIEQKLDEICDRMTRVEVTLEHMNKNGKQ